MKRFSITILFLTFFMFCYAQIGAPYIHDPSTILNVMGSIILSAQEAGDLSQKMDGPGTEVLFVLEEALPLTR